MVGRRVDARSGHARGAARRQLVPGVPQGARDEGRGADAGGRTAVEVAGGEGVKSGVMPQLKDSTMATGIHIAD